MSEFRDAWEREYRDVHGVPTSLRPDPSTAVYKLADFAEAHPDFTIGDRVLDLGCGNGRNARYFGGLGAQVMAVDFAANALHRAQESVAGTPLADRIATGRLDLTRPLPFADNSFDTAVDIVTTMTLPPDARANLAGELRRVVKDGGHFLTYVLSANDGYPREEGADKITVPESGITDWFIAEEELRRNFAEWEVRCLEETRKTDTFQGGTFERCIWWGLFQNSKAN